MLGMKLAKPLLPFAAHVVVRPDRRDGGAGQVSHRFTSLL